ncbi:sugar ABC transporter permease [Nocardioides sp. GY 10127]|uniref:carbohydrate ABC transporter permease n=1 Tax=Nocardioides sp. GY 10127 TaxID=2569762 RepID=UPI0010A902F9|nr:sugar ABC transporter permease [Nocardioides sp. GY 10127]TIC79268.1 sugar ABC transporter permease [Nocardioides sp. GY 10127]
MSVVLQNPARGEREAARPTVAPRPRGGKGTARRRDNVLGWALSAPAAALLGLFFVLPLGLTVWMSFFDWPAFGPHTAVGTENYQQIATDSKFRDAVVFTVLYTVVTSVLGLALSLALALLVRPRMRWRTGIRAMLFAPVTIGFAPAGLLWLSMSNSRTGVLPSLARDLGLADQGTDWFAHAGSALAVVVVMTLWKTVGLAMLVLIIGMDAIPDDVYEAAQLDGASAVSTLLRITLPLVRKPLSLVVLLTVSTTFLSFDQFFTMTKGGPDNRTVSVVYYLYNAAFVGLDRGYAAAVAVVVVVVMAVISLPQAWLQRGGAQ